MKCEKEIGEWVSHVIRKVETAGKDLLAEMEDMIHDKLEAVGEDGSTMKPNCAVSTRKISFVPNDMLEWSNLGFLAIDDVMPTDFHLDLVTLLKDVHVGGKITFVLSCHKEISKTLIDFLHCCVVHKISKLI